jgi:hypothetical protein
MFAMAGALAGALLCGWVVLAFFASDEYAA